MSTSHDELFGLDAIDEMLRGTCAAYVAGSDDCSGLCIQRCEGEAYLAQWAAAYDLAVDDARELAASAASSRALAAIARRAIGISNPPEVSSLADWLGGVS